MGRSALCLRGGERRCRHDRGRPHGLCPRAAGGIQDTQGGGVSGIAENIDGQDSEIRTAAGGTGDVTGGITVKPLVNKENPLRHRVGFMSVSRRYFLPPPTDYQSVRCKTYKTYVSFVRSPHR